MIKKLKIESYYKIFSRLSKRDKTILYVVSFFIIIILFERIFIHPIYSRFRSLNKEIKEKESSIAKGLRILAQKDKIQNEINKYSSYVNSYRSEEEAITSLLKEIENLANKGSLYIVDMKPQGVKEDKEKTKKYVVTLTCEGQMEQVMDFMYNVENSQILLVIEKYQINPKTKESSIAQCVMTISRTAISQ